MTPPADQRPAEVVSSLGWGRCRPSPFVAWTFDFPAWEDANGDVVKGQPSFPEDVYGVWVHVYDERNPERQDYFWVHLVEPFDDWDDLYDLIIEIAGQHGFALA